MFTVSGTPVLSSTILLRTYDEGTFVGNGPSVSVGASVQEPLFELLLLPFVPVDEFASSFLQDANGAIAAMPNAAIPFLKNALRSMILVFYGDENVMLFHSAAFI